MKPAVASPLYRTAIVTAWVAGIFLAGVCSTMLYQRFTATSSDPWKSPQLLKLKEQLRASPKDEKIKEQIRELDLQFRQRFVRRLAMNRTGSWLLFGGGLVLLVSLTVAVRERRTRHRILREPEAGDRLQREAAAGRRAVGVGGVVVVVAMVAVAFGIRSSITAPRAAPKGAGGAGKDAPAGASAAVAVPAAEALPPPAEFLANWPRFRGPTGGAVAASADVPLKWDGKSGEGIAWKVEVPAPGFNSPVVWGDLVFLSGGTIEQRAVFCFNAADGKLRWRRDVEKIPGGPAQVAEISDQTGYAAPTTATDGLRVYALFGTGELVAVKFDGTLAWAKHLGTPKNMYGHATSLAIWQGRLFVQFDQGETGPVNSRLIALDGASGRVIWEKPRPVPSSWASPIVAEAAGKTQIFTLGVPFIIAYAAADGAELWRAELLDGEVTPSPIFAGGLLLAINPHSALLALRPDGTGDVSSSHVSWKAEDDIPDVPSPVSNGELVFTVASSGNIVCFDIKDGKKVWEHDLRSEVQASPVIAGNRLYVLCTNGLMLVAEAAREFKELARNRIEEKFIASPAPAKGRMYLRGIDNLYCVTGEAAKPANP